MKKLSRYNIHIMSDCCHITVPYHGNINKKCGYRLTNDVFGLMIPKYHLDFVNNRLSNTLSVAEFAHILLRKNIGLISIQKFTVK